MALTVAGLAVERGGRLALVAPDFCVERGQAALVTGPNGAGKSTLLRALAGLIRQSRGRIQLDGDEDVSQHVAYVGHLDAVKPALSVRANLNSWAALYGAGADVDAVLESFGISHIAGSPAAYCSAGQKRRLGLARLLVTGRRVWLLDEPTVSLDAAASANFAKIVAAHCEEGGIAVAATHVEIALPEGPRVELLPPAARAADAADPFLAGAWA